MSTNDLRRFRFTILCNSDERELIKAIAQKLRRSQGDAVRYFLVEAGKGLFTTQNTKSGSLPEITYGDKES